VFFSLIAREHAEEYDELERHRGHDRATKFLVSAPALVVAPVAIRPNTIDEAS
jgi:hypothetical protein